jgi:hypothetical protein
MHAVESSNSDAWAAPDKAVIFGPVSPKYTPCVMPKPVRSVLFLFLLQRCQHGSLIPGA